MVAEITKTDQVVFHSVGGWHGLGLVLPEALTPRQVVPIAFPYTVAQKHLFYHINGRQLAVNSHMVNVRSDNGDELGVVSENYKCVQPMDMADFCEALIEENDGSKILCETAGSIRGGKKLWFLLKGEPFHVAKGDEMIPYILVSNGYDGLTSFRVTPTTVRVVCSNTLHAVIPYFDSGALGQSVISIRHTENVMERIAEARMALKNYSQAIEQTRVAIDTLVGKEVTSDEVKQFFLDQYQASYGEIPTNPKDKVDANKRDRAMSAFTSFSKRWDDDLSLTGPTAWGMFNAMSGLIQHDKKGRGVDDAGRIEKRVDSNLFGLNSQRTQDAFAKAFKMALAS